MEKYRSQSTRVLLTGETKLHTDILIVVISFIVKNWNEAIVHKQS